jgi:hypothetical protein
MRAGMSRRRTGLVAILWLMFGVCVLAPGDAVAGEAVQLKIKHFSLQTTQTVELPGTREYLEIRKAQDETARFTHDNYGFENVPVPFTQAGGHPDGLTFRTEFESEEINGKGPTPTRDAKDIAVALPPGLLGNPAAVSRCPLKVVLSGIPCPAGTQLGVAVLYILHGEGRVAPIVNVIPEAGQSAEFAIETKDKLDFLLTGHVVRTPEGYGITVVDNGIPNVELSAAELTFWGNPAAKSHDSERGLACGRLVGYGIEPWSCGNTMGRMWYGGEESQEPEVSFLTLPTDCKAGPTTAVMKADSWEQPGHVGVNGRYEGYVEAQYPMPAVTGCNALRFNPGIEVEPDTLLADAPVGLGVNVLVPQFEEPQRLATPELRNAVVTLPLGMSVSPGIVDGIQACNESGPEGINFTGPESEEIGLNGEPQLAPGHCPDASIVGTARVITPLLREPIEGHVYLARPGCGNAALGQVPCTEQDALDGNLYKLYLELGGKGPLAGTGVNLKFPGDTEANPATGQLTTRFEGIPVGNPPRLDGNPQLPFSKLEVHLNGGPRAPIDNPPVCGPAVTTADFTPWAEPGLTPEGVFVPGVPDGTPSSFFDVQDCGNPPGLLPGFVAGTVTPNAGKFTKFTLDISRKDREQYVKGVQVHTPPGLLGLLSSVSLCGEAQANDPVDNGECPQSSKIGTTRVASGAGSHPFEIEGSIYITGPYHGAPFGLSIVTNAIAGPFDLGKVVVRARIDVDPTTSALTVTTDETGPYALPEIVFGVPLRLQRITVNVDRPDFMFNPTNCAQQQVTAVISGNQNATATVSSPYAVGNCTSLSFKPQFTVATSGHNTRNTGASLNVALSYPKGSMGIAANIARVKVSLPKQLPSYLPTLQKACLAATFNTNPANCPSGSIVGIAKATTPLLPVGLAGPVYFVSHGGEQFPSLIIVLQGDNVRVDLVGSTFISKGITSSTFKTIPDVPVNTFQLYLPQGKYHALAANGNLCHIAAATANVRKRTITTRVHGRLVHKTITVHQASSTGGLIMPTEFDAQNGAILHQNTKITVTGCPATASSANARRSTTRANTTNNHKAHASHHGQAGTRHGGAR